MRGREIIKKKSNMRKYQEILIKSSICTIIVLLSLYYIFPIFLNYPKNILEEEFQKKIMGITYNTQFIIFSISIYLIIFISLVFAYKSTKIVEGEKRVWPIGSRKARITSHYGPRVNPVTKRQSFHSGIDLGIGEGENLYAVSSGVITFSGFKGPYRIYYYT